MFSSFNFYFFDQYLYTCFVIGVLKCLVLGPQIRFLEAGVNKNMCQFGVAHEILEI